ncbi:MAG: hypothetical protein ABIE23_00205 [archaeon]|nr:hypothetical protein [Candidatus Micrarchaeota archaeon]
MKQFIITGILIALLALTGCFSTPPVPTKNTCESFSYLIPVVSHRVEDSTMKLKINNGTRGKMDDIGFTVNGTIGDLEVEDSGTNKNKGSLEAGDSVSYELDLGKNVQPGQSYYLKITMTYNDGDGYPRTNYSTCRGTA